MSDDQNEVVIKSGKKIGIAPDFWELRDDGTKPVFVDFFTEARQYNGTVFLSLGTGIIDGENTPMVDIACRLRMNLTVAQSLHQILGGIIADALKPIDKSTAN